jgi:hypothetical protein
VGTLETIEQIELQLAELQRQEGEAAAKHQDAVATVERLNREIGTKLIGGADVTDLQAQLATARTALDATMAHVNAIPAHRKPLQDQLGPLQLQAAREKLQGLEADTVRQLQAYAKALVKAYEVAEPLLGITQGVASIKHGHMSQLSPRYSTFSNELIVGPVEKLLAVLEKFCPSATEAANTSVEKRKARRQVQNYPKTINVSHRFDQM